MKNLKNHNPTLRVIDILKAVHCSQDGLSFTELVNTTQISKGTLHPILTTLLNEEFLQSDGCKITIGKNCFKVGNAYVHSLNFIDIIRPHMIEIVAGCGEICQLGILDNKDVLYIEKTEPKQSIRLESYVGKTLAAYATALGKTLLASLKDSDIKELYGEEFHPYTTKTVANLDELLAQLSQIRQDGYAHEIGETNLDIECIAVALKLELKIKASLSVSLPIFRSTPQKLEQIKQILATHAKLISQEINSLATNLKLN